MGLPQNQTIMPNSTPEGSATNLPFPPTVAQLYGRALWDPKPTKTIKSQKQLAYALGYPFGWRVERVVEKDKVDGTKSIIRDRIHATVGSSQKKMTKCTWFHHDAAQKAAQELEANGGNLDGSHLLPPIPLYAKGDIVQVWYEGSWWDCTIIKRKKQGDEFLYTVKYHEEDATSDDVEESELRPGLDPSQLAVEQGFTSEWTATKKGKRYVFTAPTGEKFKTKKAAMKFFKQKPEKEEEDEEEANDLEDPPWRTEGHEWIGRQLVWGTLHRISGTRKVHVDQIGTIEGYIEDTDVDKEGNPGFISEKTGKPAKLFHVVFPDEPHHMYASFLLETTDLEEHEIADNLLEESLSKKRKQQAAAEKSPPQKKKRGRR